MQRTNHWFVAYDQGAELRISGWNSRSRLRAGAKHLCGHTCLHKLVDDFMARTLAVRVPLVPEDKTGAQQKLPRPTTARNDTQLDFVHPHRPDQLEPRRSERVHRRIRIIRKPHHAVRAGPAPTSASISICGRLARTRLRHGADTH